MLEESIVLVQIIFIDVIMAADNAIIIAMIAANFAPKHRKLTENRKIPKMSRCLKWVAVKDGEPILCGVRAAPRIYPLRPVLTGFRPKYIKKADIKVYLNGVGKIKCLVPRYQVLGT